MQHQSTCEILFKEGILIKSKFGNQILDAVVKLNLPKRLEKRGALVFSQGTDGHTFFVIGSGKIELQFDGRTRRLLNSGDFFGELAALGKVKRTATAHAMEDTVLYELSPDDCERLFKLNESLRDEILFKYSLRLLHSKTRHDPSMIMVQEQQLEEALKLFKTKKLQANEYLFEEDHFGGSIFFLLRGEVELTRRGKLLMKRGPGEFIGEIAALQDIPRTASAMATTNCELLECPLENIPKLLLINKAFEKHLRNLAFKRFLTI